MTRSRAVRIAGLTAASALAALVVTVAGLFALLCWEPVWLFHGDEIRTGNAIVRRGEEYRTSHGGLPETLDEIGFSDPDLKVYYRKDGEDPIWCGLDGSGWGNR